MAYNGVVCMMATSKVPVKFGEGNGRSRGGEVMNQHLLHKKQLGAYLILAIFSALLPSQTAEHLFHSGFQFNSILCVRIHVIDRNFLSVSSSNIHGPQATSAVSCSIVHSNLNSHFKLAH